MRSRAFGVEIECGVSACKAKAAKTKYGPETPGGYNDFWCEDDGWANERFIVDKVDEWVRRGLVSREWRDRLGWDGTLVELRSPILRGPLGFKELRMMMKLLRQNGGFITDADGLHVHHDAPEFVASRELVGKLVESWVANFKHIEKLVSDWRIDYDACPSWDDYSLRSVKDWARQGGGIRPGYGSWSRNDLNISSLWEHGTIELRIHEGTLDFGQAEAWIRFGQAFINKVAAGQALEPVSETAELLRRIRCLKRVQPKLLKAAA